MMNRFLTILLIALLTACTTGSNSSSDIESDDTVKNYQEKKSKIFEAEEQEEYRNIVFSPILSEKERKDKKNLKIKLVQSFKKLLNSKSTISNLYATGIYGSEDTLWVVELKEEKDSSCLPEGRRIQLLFNNRAELVRVDSAVYLKWIKFKNDKNPLLMTLNTNCSEKGRHHFYKYENGSLVDMFNVLLDNTPFTYDSEIISDKINYQPAELELTMEDLNEDGKTDLIFSGVKQFYENQSIIKSQTVRYVFIYEPNEDWFVMKNNFSKAKSKNNPKS